MDKKAYKNYIYNMVYQVLTIIIPLVTTPYVSHVLSIEEMGVYNYTYTVCLYFSFAASMGFPIFGQREIAIAYNQKEKDRVFSELVICRTIIGIVVAIVYFIMSFFCFDNRNIYLIQGIGLVAAILDISWYYAGNENFKTITNRNIIVKFISTILLFVVVRNSHVLIKYTFIITLPNLVGNLLLFYKSGVHFEFIKINLKRFVEIINKSFFLLIPSLVLQLSNLIDKTILGTLSNMKEVGLYSQIFKIVNLLVVITCALGTVLFPVLSNLVSQYNLSKLRNCMRDASSLILHVSVPMAIGLILISDIFVPWFFGTKYLVLIKFIPYTAPLIIIMGFSNLFGNQFLVAADKTKILTVNILIGVIVNIGMDVLLIPKWGVLGAIIASVISEFLVLFIDVLFYRQNIGGKLFSIDWVKCFFGVILMSLVMIYLKNILQIRLIAETIIILACGMTVYFIVLLLLKDQVIFGFFNRKRV